MELLQANISPMSIVWMLNGRLLVLLTFSVTIRTRNHSKCLQGRSQNRFLHILPSIIPNVSLVFNKVNTVRLNFGTGEQPSRLIEYCSNAELSIFRLQEKTRRQKLLKNAADK